jgi:uncharacterized membrane protein YphA (DoxX/SURF4 family)
MRGVTGLFLVAGTLLVVSGVAKLRSVEPTRNALHGAGLPGPVPAVVVLGAAEVAAGSSAVVTQSRPAAAATVALYLGFAGFVVLARLRGGPDASCGCFGRREAPAGGVHLLTTLALATVASLVAVAPGPGLLTQLGDAPLRTVVLIGYSALTTWLVYLVIAVLPRIREVLAQG